MTQEQLAQQLYVSRTAISKWESGKSMPDSGIMLKLCEILKINVNELLSGERIMAEKYDKHAEENLIKLKRENEEQTKRLLSMEWVIGGMATVSYLILIFASVFIEMEMYTRIILFVLAFILLVIGVSACIFIEQRAGYYECGYRYVPSYKQVFCAMHNGRSRLMKCPECGQKSWQKKVISNE